MYGSSIKVSSAFETKKPFTKYTPACTFTELAKPVALDVVGNEVPEVPTTAVDDVLLYVNVNVSPSVNLFVCVSVPEAVYTT